MNAYCTVDQVMLMYDLRTVLDLSGDDNRHEGQAPTLQFLLDMQASELDSVIQGRYGSVPLAGELPLILTKWVGVTGCRRFFARRNDEPPQLKSDAEWADQWMEALMDNKIGIPGVARVALPNRVAGRNLDHHYCGPTIPADCD